MYVCAYELSAIGLEAYAVFHSRYITRRGLHLARLHLLFAAFEALLGVDYSPVFYVGPRSRICITWS